MGFPCIEHLPRTRCFPTSSLSLRITLREGRAVSILHMRTLRLGKMSSDWSPGVKSRLGGTWVEEPPFPPCAGTGTSGAGWPCFVCGAQDP